MEASAGQIIIAGLIMVAFITGGFTVLSSFVPSTDSNFQNYNNTYSKFNEMNENSQAISDTVNKVDKPSNSLFGIVDSLVGLSYGALKQVWTTISTITAILNDLTSSMFGLPFWFVGLFSSIILISIAFALMAAWFKWRV